MRHLSSLASVSAVATQEFLRLPPLSLLLHFILCTWSFGTQKPTAGGQEPSPHTQTEVMITIGRAQLSPRVRSQPRSFGLCSEAVLLSLRLTLIPF